MQSNTVDTSSATGNTESDSSQHDDTDIDISSINIKNMLELKEALSQFIISAGSDTAFAYISLDSSIANDLFLKDIVNYINDINDYNNIVLLTPSGLYVEADSRSNV